MEIVAISSAQLADYARVPIAFEVRTIFDLDLPENGLGGIHFHERAVTPYFKDYDQLGSPLTWPSEFDLQNWGIFLALKDDLPVGGAAVAWNTNGVNMLEGRRDLSVLWDIRVLPAWRGRGVGRNLFGHARDWSKSRDCVQMKIETQNINVAACRFYAAQGAKLGDIRRFAYLHEPSVAHEVQLNWYLEL
jgi:GNAT superfamily N-acetyltransferase